MKTTIESVQNGWVVECFDARNTPTETRHVFQKFPDLLAALPELLNEYRLTGQAYDQKATRSIPFPEQKNRETFDDTMRNLTASAETGLPVGTKYPQACE